MTRNPESVRPDALRLRIKQLNDRIKELEAAPAASSSSSGGLTSPIALTDIDPTGASDGDVITLASGVWTYATPSAGGVISGFVNVTMNGDSGTATFTNGAITVSSVITVAIAGVTKSDHGPEDHAVEELQVYATNQIDGSVDVLIVSPNGGSFGDYQVNVIGV